MSDHQDDSPRPGFLRSLLIVLLWFTRIFRPVAIVMRGNDQRDAEDRAMEQWKPQQKELVESGQADYCSECEGKGVIYTTREYSSATFELWCSRCEGLGVLMKR